MRRGVGELDEGLPEVVGFEMLINKVIRPIDNVFDFGQRQDIPAIKFVLCDIGVAWISSYMDSMGVPDLLFGILEKRRF